MVGPGAAECGSWGTETTLAARLGTLLSLLHVSM